MQICFEKRLLLKQKPDFSQLSFGKTFTDYMFIMDYDNGCWHSQRIVPYGPVEFSPASCVLHYGQALFEGMKAYKGDAGQVYLFRPKENFKRLNEGCRRLCIPEFDEQTALEALNELIDIERNWVPEIPGSSLYIRPFIIADEEVLGVHSAKKYKFIIILSPVGSYYSGGLSPIDILVEDIYVRSAPQGGTGAVKAIGNYAASLKGQQRAENGGFSQVLWLDGIHRRFVEEVGSMNIFFVFDDEICTPALSGSILPGITRRSVIELAKNMGVDVVQRAIAIDEIVSRAHDGTLKEIFGTGTAVVVSPVGSLCFKGESVKVGGGSIGKFTQQLYDTLTGIQFGKIPDLFGWRVEVPYSVK